MEPAAPPNPAAAANVVIPVRISDSLMHKNRLQEYTQRSSISLPVYRTVNEGGLPHAPMFKSTVTVDGTDYTSVNTFSQRKEAEQDVARLALQSISRNIQDQGCPLLHQEVKKSQVNNEERGNEVSLGVTSTAKVEKPTGEGYTESSDDSDSDSESEDNDAAFAPSVFAFAPSGTGPTSAAYDPAFAPSVSQAAPANCYTPQHSVSSNGVWSNGMPCQQQQNMVFPNGFPTDGVPYQNQFQHQMLQNQHQMLMGFPNGMPIQQQMPYGQPNYSSGPPMSMPMFMGQPGFNQTQFGMGFQGYLSPNVNQGGQLQSQGPLNEQSQLNFSAQHQSTQGETSTRGKRSYKRRRRRRGGYPSRGRGRR